MERKSFIKSLFLGSSCIFIPKLTKPIWGTNRKRIITHHTGRILRIEVDGVELPNFSQAGEWLPRGVDSDWLMDEQMLEDTRKVLEQKTSQTLDQVFDELIETHSVPEIINYYVSQTTKDTFQLSTGKEIIELGT